jgi:hypothetical protein
MRRSISTPACWCRLSVWPTHRCRGHLDRRCGTRSIYLRSKSKCRACDQTTIGRKDRRPSRTWNPTMKRDQHWSGWYDRISKGKKRSVLRLTSSGNQFSRRTCSPKEPESEGRITGASNVLRWNVKRRSAGINRRAKTGRSSACGIPCHVGT